MSKKTLQSLSVIIAVEYSKDSTLHVGPLHSALGIMSLSHFPPARDTYIKEILPIRRTAFHWKGPWHVDTEEYCNVILCDAFISFHNSGRMG